MRVIVVDDSVIVREGLRRLLEVEGHEVAAALSRPDPVAGLVGDPTVDAVVLDIRLPPSFTDEGIRVAADLRARRGDLAILVLSQYAVPEYATRLLAAGAAYTGYLLKDRVLEPLQLSQTLHRLGAGGTVVDPDVVGELLAARHRKEPLDSLTAREREVLQLMAEGLSDRGIAERMYVSLNTVGTHVRHIFRKLELSDGTESNRRVLAVLAALQSRT
ncbi:LuxR C-terminal-related transcriptional regulator [Virgisporangium ochraceum]|uniref:DNA-binding response regulator n=1 Tax=Virgisporangium ochraceum TaxID=65505 RepID=A0A8J3ZYH4_9ACTN|nr:response regulator transcription factor [Virgisporangium ochraceum]GIJ71568.1 DNA-binding response regulator [Virgisporangium ochraceum]